MEREWKKITGNERSQEILTNRVGANAAPSVVRGMSAVCRHTKTTEQKDARLSRKNRKWAEDPQKAQVSQTHFQTVLESKEKSQESFYKLQKKREKKKQTLNYFELTLKCGEHSKSNVCRDIYKNSWE